jgi:hypothetical protein
MIWDVRAEGGPVSRTVKGEDVVTQNCSKRGLFLLEIGKKDLFFGRKSAVFRGFCLLISTHVRLVKLLILLHLT